MQLAFAHKLDVPADFGRPRILIGNIHVIRPNIFPYNALTIRQLLGN
jgi:hypothetical protein